MILHGVIIIRYPPVKFVRQRLRSDFVVRYGEAVGFVVFVILVGPLAHFDERHEEFPDQFLGFMLYR